MLNKKNILCSVLASLASAFLMANASAAVDSGAYVGGQAGWGTIHQDGFSTSHNNSSDSGLAGRLFAGYQVNQNFAAEMGYTKFKNESTKATFGLITATGSIKTYAVDLVAKGIMPLQNGVSLYGKLGAAYLNETAHASVGSFSASTTQSKILPTFGAGVSYDLTQNVATDLSWTRIQKVGSTDLNSTDLVALGLAYHFG